MQGYAYAEGCRRGYVLRYFGDPAAMDECGACDNCLGGHGELGERLGGVDTRSGKRPRGRGEREDRRGADFRDAKPPRPAPPTGAPRTERQDELFQRLRTMRRELARKADVAPFIVFTDATLEALATAVPETPEEALAVPGIGPGRLEKYGHALFETLAAWVAEHGRPQRDASFDPAAATRSATRPSRERKARAAGDGDDLPPPTAAEAALYGKLKALRSELAKSAGLPAYCIFPDRTLIELARRRPGTEDDMLSVPGVGAAKLEKYGEAFLAALAGGEG
jgi:ATP-dependent DNA helicase RecQ